MESPHALISSLSDWFWSEDAWPIEAAFPEDASPGDGFPEDDSPGAAPPQPQEHNMITEAVKAKRIAVFFMFCQSLFRT
jgi:hypothetical protein